MSEALAQRADALRVDVPRDVWRRGKRPGRGLFFRVTLALTFVFVGIGMPTLQLQVALVALGIITFAMLPVFTDSRLASIEKEVQWADRTQAAKLLQGLEQRRLVALFAPFAWVQLQRGRLHLRLGDGRGAARAFAEAARLCGQPEQPALMSAQAHGLTLSGDRKEAQTLLRSLEKRGALGPYDRLNLGIGLIEEGRAKQAAEQLEQAVEVLDQHPRALAALALALAKADRVEEAVPMFERAEAVDDLDDDALAPDLLKRARKALRGAEAGKAPRRSAEPASQGGAKSKKGSQKRRKKDKRKERRERRKGGKDTTHETGSSPAPEQDTAVESGVAEPAAEQAERAKAEPAAEQAERAKAEREQAEREQAERAKAEREQAERAKAERAKAERAEAEAAERAKAEREKAEREKAAQEEREKAAQEEREKAAQEEREKAEREPVEPPAPKPPPVVFEGDKPVFRPPSIPPPPVLQDVASTRPGTPAPPKIAAGPVVPPRPDSKPAAVASPAPPDDDWGDVFGDDAAPVVPVAGKKNGD